METDLKNPRILIGASSFADAAAALNILRLLKPRGSLGGLLVEEHQTIALCQTLNQQIITLGGTMMCMPDMAQLRTLMDADEKAFRTTLAQLSEPFGAHWTFERSEGDLVQISLKASSGWDIVVLGCRKVHPRRGRVLLLETAGMQNPTLKRFADQLSDRMSATRVVFSVGQGVTPSHGVQSFGTVQDMLAALARTNAQAVLLDVSQGPIRSAVGLKHLLDVARCPVFAFGAAGLGRVLEHSTQIPPFFSTDRDVHDD